MSVRTGKKPYCACELNWCPVCGLRKCQPRRNAKWADGTLKSAYQRDYDEKKGLGRDPRGELADKDKLLVPSSGAFDGLTTHKKDFTPKSAQPWQRKGKDATFPARPFEGQSTYNSAYDGKHGPASEAIRKSVQPYHAPFNGLTTNQADYVQWGDQRRTGGAPLATMPQVPFDGTTTYRDDFTNKPMPPRDPRNPAPLLPSNNKDNYTTYGTDYVPKEVKLPPVACCDDPRHGATHVHDHPTLRPGQSTVFKGTATGRLYRTR